MTSEFDRRLNDWFDAVEPKSVPSDILPSVFSQVGQTGQLRAPWHQLTARMESAWTSRSPLAPSTALVLIAVLLITVLAALAVAAGLIRLPVPPKVVDGLIAVQDELAVSGGHYVIRFIDPQSGADAFTTPGGARACGAHFSPDGSQYAFLSEHPNQDILVSVAPAVRDFAPRELVRKPIQAYFDPAWSPDGSALVMTMELPVEGGYISELWTLPMDGTPGRRLTDVQITPVVDWSPSGEWIAFVGGAQHALYIVRPDGRELRALRPNGVDSIAWAPARDELAYGASDGRLHVISLDGREIFAAGQNSAGPPMWSPDATKIALVAESSLQVFDVATGSVVVIGTPSPVARAAWSASGRTLVVVTDAGELWEVSVDGTAPRLIADHVTARCMSSGVALSWQQLRQ